MNIVDWTCSQSVVCKVLNEWCFGSRYFCNHQVYHPFVLWRTDSFGRNGHSNIPISVGIPASPSTHTNYTVDAFISCKFYVKPFTTNFRFIVLNCSPKIQIFVQYIYVISQTTIYRIIFNGFIIYIIFIFYYLLYLLTVRKINIFEISFRVFFL